MKPILIAVVLVLGGAAAQSYPIDCAILLCLAGGWPASVPCARARAEFIRRITPWPVEPPLQIWNCPMHAAFRIEPQDRRAARRYDIAFAPQSIPRQPFAAVADVLDQGPFRRAPATSEAMLAVLGQSDSVRPSRGATLQLAQAATIGNSADIDISGSEFDFVRSIKVWQVEYRHFENRSGDCTEYDQARLGAYRTQGDYRWTRSSAHVAPAWMGVNLACTKTGGLYRGVRVEWVDYLGKPWHELVRY